MKDVEDDLVDDIENGIEEENIGSENGEEDGDGEEKDVEDGGGEDVRK